jgi:hypothetical protein
LGKGVNQILSIPIRVKGPDITILRRAAMVSGRKTATAAATKRVLVHHAGSAVGGMVVEEGQRGDGFLSSEVDEDHDSTIHQPFMVSLIRLDRVCQSAV